MVIIPSITPMYCTKVYKTQFCTWVLYTFVHFFTLLYVLFVLYSTKHSFVHFCTLQNIKKFVKTYIGFLKFSQVLYFSGFLSFVHMFCTKNFVCFVHLYAMYTRKMYKSVQKCTKPKKNCTKVKKCSNFKVFVYKTICFVH